MNGDIFVFGSKIFIKETEPDALTSLPLELSWKIFSYLDDATLRMAYNLHRPWARIIASDMKLRKRLNRFNLILKLGPSLAKFYRRNRRKMKNQRNYIQKSEATVYTMRKMLTNSKRGGDNIIVHTKRFRLF